MVAPYDFPSARNNKALHQNSVPAAKNGIGSRYNKDNFFDDNDEFSRDVSKAEDHGFGDDDEFDGVMFDDEDLYGDKNEVKAFTKNNNNKMMLDELGDDFLGGGGDTDQDLR